MRSIVSRFPEQWDGNPCDSDEDKKAMKFTVGGEYASAFSGVQIELDSESSFSKVKVRLDKGELEGRIATLSYAGDATRKSSGRFRGTFESDGDISLEVGEEYWIRIGRNVL